MTDQRVSFMETEAALTQLISDLRALPKNKHRSEQIGALSLIVCQLASERAERSQDNDDLVLAAEASALRAAYGGHWGKHPEYPVNQWQLAVEGFDTRLGYWEWIANAQRGQEKEPVT